MLTGGRPRAVTPLSSEFQPDGDSQKQTGRELGL